MPPSEPVVETFNYVPAGLQGEMPIRVERDKSGRLINIYKKKFTESNKYAERYTEPVEIKAEEK